jgi:Fe2+ or Zn2+ uptake regulation protein
VEPTRILLARHGLRCTRQREMLYECLAGSKAHPTAEELFQMASARAGRNDEALSLATVYNTLEVFTDRGLCRRLSSPSGACRYDADMRDHVHVATPDGRVCDLPDDLSHRLLQNLPSDLKDEIEKRLGIRVHGLSVQVSAAPDGH